MSHPLADIFREAADLNARDDRREANILHLAPGKDVLATGDLHGHRANLTKILAAADLANHPDRRLILQEIIHAPLDARTGHDRSVDVLLRAARLKIAHPEQVIFLLGNHDVAQAIGNEITKAGVGMREAFIRGVRYACGSEGAEEILEAIDAFLLSAPIAARCPGGVMISHTLPTPKRMDLAGWDPPAGPYRPEDLRRGGCVYEWTWGRKQTCEQIDRLADHLGVCFFILGHRQIDTGFEFIHPKAVIITADHERGCVLPFPSDAPLTEETASQCLAPIAALGRREGPLRQA